MNPLHDLEKQGQGIWLDYIRRNLLTSGELKRLVDEDGLSGVTSNPTIFEKAIAGSTDYDAALRDLLGKDSHLDSNSLFWSVAVEDIRNATDVVRPVYDRTGGVDGFISLEVSPLLAHDTQNSISEARRLWKLVGRPNLMIKIPSTPEGIPAIEQLLSEGINVNITLMFSMHHYEQVAQAYIRGLSRCTAPEKVASVASFFVSRVDTLIDPMLEKNGKPEALALRGKIAIANSKNVYKRFQEIFDGDSFAALRKKGARVQRVLWASTSTKNPKYPDVLYVSELVGPHTVNTIPPATLDAFRDHGKVRGNTILENVDEAIAQLDQLNKVGIDLHAVGEQLQVEGVASFSKSFDDLMGALDKKRSVLLSAQADVESHNLGSIGAAVEKRLASWCKDDYCKRMWAKDPTLWSAKPVPEITDRLGWLHLPEIMHAHVQDLTQFREQIKKEGFTHAVLLGMGGSSLAPKVFQETFGNGKGYPELIVLDSTHPAAVKAVEKSIDLAHTLFIVSSKSGTTTEMLSFFYYFWKKVMAINKTPGTQFVAITDPGTPLEKLGHDRSFRHVFSATPDVGGRYSALTHFGLVPAAVIGIDLNRLLDRAWTMEEACTFCAPDKQNPGLQLGAVLGESTLAGRDKVTFLASKSLAAFPTWLEQLIAESTGKDDKGIVPVADEATGAPGVYGADRLFVYLHMNGDTDGQLQKQVAALESAGHPIVRIALSETADIGQEFFRWEIGIAAAGTVIGIQPFNQPDVQHAKDLARQAMKKAGAEGSGGAPSSSQGRQPVPAANANELKHSIDAWLSTARPGDYFGFDAYLAPTAETSAALENIRTILRDRTKLATMLGYGPRFLHSTGQLHKGGPNTGLFLQILDEPAEDLSVPETDYTFATLIRAQAQGDFGALEQRGRRTLRVQLGKDVAGGLRQIAEVLRG